MPYPAGSCLRRLRLHKCVLATIAAVSFAVYAPGQVAGPAYNLVNARSSQNQSQFFVYQDVDSPFNHGFPSGVFGSSPAAMAKLRINPACVYSAGAVNGCAIDPATLDQTRGTVFQITVAPLASGEFTGLNFEEPENWGQMPRGNGYNLTGATQLVFDALSTSGMTVYFNVNQQNSAYMTIPARWTTVAIPLSSLGLTSLTEVHVLFGVTVDAAHSPTGGTILLDNIHFTSVPASQTNSLGFPLANQVFGVVHVQNILAGTIPIPPDQVEANLATLYESSLAVTALVDRGQHQDLVNAQLIADTMVYALGHDNQGDPLPAPGSLSGLHSGTFAGDIALFNTQGALAGQQGQVRLAGYSASGECPQTGFCLLLDGATGGDNAFAIQALVAAYKEFQKQSYLDAALAIGNWIFTALLDTSGAGYGGYFAGYPNQGITPKTVEPGKSTENNADIFAAFSALAAAEAASGNTAAATTWTNRANIAGDFVMKMFDPATGHFFAGTAAAGQTGTGIKPTGAQQGNEIINEYNFIDTETFTTLALAPAARYQNQIDWRLPIQYALEHFAVSVTAAGSQFQGFNLIDSSGLTGPQGVAWEFTGQMVAAMRLVDTMYGTSQFSGAAQTYLNQIRRAQTLAPFGDGQGIVASTLQGGDTIPPYSQCLMTPFQCIAERVGLAATLWGIAAEQGLDLLNPFPSIGKNGSVESAGFSSAVSAGGLASIFGSNLAVANAAAQSIPLPIELAGTTVTVNGIPAPLLFVSPTQINLQIPWQTSPPASVTVTSLGAAGAAFTLPLGPFAPGIFVIRSSSSSTQAAVQINNTTVVAAPVGAISGLTSRPAIAGDVLTIYCSGLGSVSNTPGSGSAAGSGSSLSSTAAPVSVTIGNQTVAAGFAGLVPGLVGLYQVNVTMPTGTGTGNAVLLTVSVGSAASNTATIAVN